MLPDLILDNESYDEILENARNMIVSIYPEWTDFNYHDPGVTMLELFALYKETQQYYLNKISPENRSKYLKLIGVLRRRKRAARSDVTLLYDDDLIVAKGTRFFAGELVFEADKRTYISSARMISCISEQSDRSIVIGKSELDFGGNLRIEPFAAKNPTEGAFLIGFDKPLPKDEVCELYFTLNDVNVKRNPIGEDDSFIPLVSMNVEYYDGSRWKPAEIVRDTTHALLFSGRLAICIAGEHRPSTLHAIKAHYLRFRITDGSYDTIPSIESIGTSYATLIQQDTKAEYEDFLPGDMVVRTTSLAVTGETRVFLKDKYGLYSEISDFTQSIDPLSGAVSYPQLGELGCTGVRVVNMQDRFYQSGVIGIGRGLPFEEFDLGTTEIEYSSFTLMTELAESNKFAEWTKVEDFARSGPADLHYILDSERGILRFGDCVRGCAPEGKILVIALKLTAGADGNVAKNKITRISGFDPDMIKVGNIRPAYGGLDEESQDECLARAHSLISTTETMVSADDCERRILATPGLRIEKCQVVDMSSLSTRKQSIGTVTSVVVKPYSESGHGTPSARYIENILAYTDRYRLLGTKIAVISPEYADISIFADVDVPFGSTNARERIVAVIEEYFASQRDNFGAHISHSALYSRIDRLDCVLAVNTLTIDASGSDVTRTHEGDLKLAPNVTAILAETDISLSTV